MCVGEAGDGALAEEEVEVEVVVVVVRLRVVTVCGSWVIRRGPCKIEGPMKAGRCKSLYCGNYTQGVTGRDFWKICNTRQPPDNIIMDDCIRFSLRQWIPKMHPLRYCRQRLRCTLTPSPTQNEAS
jgi:hypothetical protein